MRRERHAVAMSVAEQLWEAERTNDIAVANAARLMALTLEARISLKAAACVGHDAIAAIAETIGRQVESRRLLLRAHEALNEVKGIAGLDELNFGGGGDKEVPLTGAVMSLPMRRAA